MNKLMISAAVAAPTIIGLTAASLGAEATVSLNVRSGPSTGYSVVDTLYAGEPVSITKCQSNGWCLIAHSGPDGWVSQRYLTNTQTSPQTATRRVSPKVSFSFSFGRGNGFSISNGPRGNNRDLVCLVTFFNRSQVAGGADANVQRADVMTRKAAERIDRPNDRRAIFDYGTNQQTRETCRYLDKIN
ncbi:MAG: SH3 domain-containing protein [Devosia sp.]